ncbi:MAG: methyltransferase [Beijerinckiaceae bacterium]
MFGDASLRAGGEELQLSLRDRILALRDRLLASERFRRYAVAFPPTRIFARRRARALFDLVAGFVYSQTLHACVSLDLFEILARGPRTAEDLAALCDLAPQSMRRLLDAAVAIDLLQPRSGDRFGLGPVGAALSGSPGIADMVRHHAMLYADLADPVGLLRDGGRSTRLGAYWPYSRSSDANAITPDAVRDYSRLMSASQRMVADEILATRPFAGSRRLLDVGGGDGTFALAVVRQYPDMKVALCDLPPVAAVARRNVERIETGAAIEVHECDFKSQPLPPGADAISLVRVLHDHDDADASALLRAIWHALPVGGGIVIGEPMAGAKAAEPMGDAYFGFYLLAMGSGRPRRPAEIEAMLEAAGFGDIASLRSRMPLVAGVITAKKVLSDKTN